jgi:HD-like signal output (HDOD) protein
MNMLEIENSVFGANHQDFGAGLCEKWKFPKTFSLVTGFHHRPFEVPADQRKLVCIVAAADKLCAELNAGFRIDVQSVTVDADLRDELKLSVEKLEEIRKALPDRLKSAGETMTAG